MNIGEQPQQRHGGSQRVPGQHVFDVLGGTGIRLLHNRPQRRQTISGKQHIRQNVQAGYGLITLNGQVLPDVSLHRLRAQLDETRGRQRQRSGNLGLGRRDCGRRRHRISGAARDPAPIDQHMHIGAADFQRRDYVISDPLAVELVVDVYLAACLPNATCRRHPVAQAGVTRFRTEADRRQAAAVRVFRLEGALFLRAPLLPVAQITRQRDRQHGRESRHRCRRKA